jgi:hypothetical protein
MTRILPPYFSRLVVDISLAKLKFKLSSTFTSHIYKTSDLLYHKGQDISSPEHPDHLWGPTSLLFTGYQDFYAQV